MTPETFYNRSVIESREAHHVNNKTVRSVNVISTGRPSNSPHITVVIGHFGLLGTVDIIKCHRVWNGLRHGTSHRVAFPSSNQNRLMTSLSSSFLNSYINLGTSIRVDFCHCLPLNRCSCKCKIVDLRVAADLLQTRIEHASQRSAAITLPCSISPAALYILISCNVNISICSKEMK